MRKRLLVLALLLQTSGFITAGVANEIADNAAMSARSGLRVRSEFRTPVVGLESLEVVWAFGLGQACNLGVTPVQDTLIWVSSGGACATTDSNYMLIYDARTRVLLDSFPQQTDPVNWGYRDLTYDPVEDVVYAGTDNNRLDKIDATTHELLASRSLEGSSKPGIVRALGFDGDSLYSADDTLSPVSKFSLDGTNCHQQADVPPYAIFGLAVARRLGRVFATTNDQSGMLLVYDYPSWNLSDSIEVGDITSEAMGGCETWKSDSFLLILGQMTQDSVFCLRLHGLAGIKDGAGRIGAGYESGIASPNPIRTQARFSFRLERRAHVGLAIYDPSGLLVRTLVSGAVARGAQRVVWDCRGADGRRVAEGTYFYRLRLDGRAVIGKLAVLK